MAEVIIQSGESSFASAVLPQLTGEFIPSVDKWRYGGGFGLVVPWGAGRDIRESMINSSLGLFAGGEETAATRQVQQLAGIVNAAMGGVTNHNYYFEGLIGPQGLPGPQGSTSVVFARDVDGHILNAPTRVIDDGATPATVANVTATAMIQAVLLEWDENSELDINHYKLYRHTSDDSGAASEIAVVYATMFVDGNRTGGTEYFYWVKAVDHLGNTSAAFSTVASATPTNVESADIVNISAGKIILQADPAVYISSWQGTDVTRIAGGKIEASSITLTSAASDFALTSISGDLDDVSDGTNYIKAPVAWKAAGKTTIDGGQIETDTILANSIKTYNLTAANATFEDAVIKTAYITDLHVTNSKIAANATSVHDVEETAAEQNLTLGTWVTVETISNFDSFGETINFTVSLNIYNSGSAYNFPVKIVKHPSTDIWTQYVSCPVAYPSAVWTSATLSFAHTPATGNNTYYVKVYTNTNLDKVSNVVFTAHADRGK